MLIGSEFNSRANPFQTSFARATAAIGAATVCAATPPTLGISTTTRRPGTKSPVGAAVIWSSATSTVMSPRISEARSCKSDRYPLATSTITAWMAAGFSARNASSSASTA